METAYPLRLTTKVVLCVTFLVIAPLNGAGQDGMVAFRVEIWQGAMKTLRAPDAICINPILFICFRVYSNEEKATA